MRRSHVQTWPCANMTSPRHLNRRSTKGGHYRVPCLLPQPPPLPLASPLTSTGSSRRCPSAPPSERRCRTSPPAALSPPTPSTKPISSSKNARSPPATAAPSPNRYILPSSVRSAVWLKPAAAATILTPPPTPTTPAPPPPLRVPRLLSPSSLEVLAEGERSGGWSGGSRDGDGGAREAILRGTAHPPANARRARARDTSRSRESGMNACCWCLSGLTVVVVVIVIVVRLLGD